MKLEKKIFVKERVMTGPYGFHVGNKLFGTDESDTESNNQENFLQTTNNIQNSQTHDDIVDVEIFQTSRSRTKKDKKANRGTDSIIAPITGDTNANNHDQKQLKSAKDVSSMPRISSRQGQSSQSIYGQKGILLERHFSSGDHAYIGDINNVATGSGNIESSTGIVDNQGHNHIVKSDTSNKLIISVSSTDLF